MKFDKYYIGGLILIIFACLLYFTSFLDMFIRPFFQIILMGSSKGKDVLFFGIFGLFLILSRFSEKHKFNILNKSNKFYLKLTLSLLIIIGLIGIVTEIYIRLVLNLPINSTFIVVNPSMTSTSIMHSHVFKSIFGYIVSSIIHHIPNGIHVGNSLEHYIPDIVKFSFILMVILFITMIKACENRCTLNRIFTVFFFTCGIIGIMDGGLFSTPGVGGIFGCLVIIYNGYLINRISPLISSKGKDTIKNNLKENPDSEFTTIVDLKTFKISLFQDLTKVYKNLKSHKIEIRHLKLVLPYLVLILIIILRFALIFAMAQTAYYEVDILNPHDSINLDDYGVISVVDENNRSIYYLSSNHNEMILLNSLANRLHSKCDSFSITWNAYSYL